MAFALFRSILKFDGVSKPDGSGQFTFVNEEDGGACAIVGSLLNVWCSSDVVTSLINASEVVVEAARFHESSFSGDARGESDAIDEIVPAGDGGTCVRLRFTDRSSCSPFSKGSASGLIAAWLARRLE